MFTQVGFVSKVNKKQTPLPVGKEVRKNEMLH